MGGTKIINVLKGDRFEEIFEEFQKAQAQEVILLVPKNSHLAKDEANFVTLASEAQSSDKTVTVMTADQKVQSLSEKYGFKFLSLPAKKTASKKVEPEEDEEAIEELPKEKMIEVSEDEDDLEENTEEEPLYSANDKDDEMTEAEREEDDEAEEKQDETVADLTMARLPARSSRTKKKKPSLSDGKKMANLESIWQKRNKDEDARWFALSASHSKKRKKAPKLNYLLLILAIAVLGLIFYFFLGSAQIIIKPQKQKLDFSLAVSSSAGYHQVDLVSRKIPGQLLSARQEITKDAPTTGQKEVAQKARGEIAVYNNYSSDPQTFVATTRFESSKGLIFRTPRAITVPGAKISGGKLVPSSVKVEVIADKPGANYNIEPDKFTLPGLKGSPKYDEFYAESAQKFSGGLTGLSKIVTEEDFNQTKAMVTEEALKKSLENLKSQTDSLKITEAVDNKIISLQSTAEAEEAAEGISMKATAEAKTLGFAYDDVLTLIKNYVKNLGDLEVLNNTLEIGYQNPKFDPEKKLLTFSLSVKGEAAARIDQEKMTKQMLGMKQSQIKTHLSGIKEIESAKVILSPFWVRAIPQNADRVKFQIVHE